MLGVGSQCLNVVAGLANKTLTIQVPIGQPEVESTNVVTEASESLVS